jgi:hypothetical protein
MDPDEKAAIVWQTEIESRVKSLEDDRRKAMWVLGAAALAVISQMWDQIKGAFFHGN